jgi:very-long-chain (3R)-3-hydroxyacyl-CoA dehydratase
MWYGLSYINANGVFVYAMPNALNFSYYHIYGIITAMIIYIPGSPFLFGHMMALRKKALAPAGAAKPKGH